MQRARRAELGKVLEHRCCKERLRECRVFSLEKSRLRDDFIILYKSLTAGCSQVGVGLFSHTASDKTTGDIILHCTTGGLG